MLGNMTLGIPTVLPSQHRGRLPCSRKLRDADCVKLSGKLSRGSVSYLGPVLIRSSPLISCPPNVCPRSTTTESPGSIINSPDGM